MTHVVTVRRARGKGLRGKAAQKRKRQLSGLSRADRAARAALLHREQVSP